MQGDETFEKCVQAELELLRAEEEEKRMLHDRTIGGTHAPRPSAAFIDKCLGALRPEAELQELARERAEKQQRLARTEALRVQEVERSIKDHNRRIEERAKRSRGGGRSR